MKVLFVHDNFPAQFGRLGAYLDGLGWEVMFATKRKDAAALSNKIVAYEMHREPAEGVHPYSATWENAVLTGQGFARTAIKLRDAGFSPDLVVAHSGWGPGMYAKDVWPRTKTVGYYEWYYNTPAPDVSYLDDRAPSPDICARSRSKNAPILMDLASCELGVCPTAWQQQQFPGCFQDKLTTHHDGIDTDYYHPLPFRPTSLKVGDVSVPEGSEIVTYVARGMEPYRGFPQFMAAFADLQRLRPNAHAVIVGEDRVAYGRQLPDGQSHRKLAFENLDLDESRVHFTGYLSRADYRTVLMCSALHVYLTVPFVLSWSMMEAMSAGCLLVASDTQPVREVMGEKEGFLVDFRDRTALADAMDEALSDAAGFPEKRAAARQAILDRYSMKKIFPEKEAMFKALCTDGQRRSKVA
ncbi:MAG: glycosyltransferase [Pseudomonadota bacterium]